MDVPQLTINDLHTTMAAAAATITNNMLAAEFSSEQAFEVFQTMRKQVWAQEIIHAVQTAVEATIAVAEPEEEIDGWNRGAKGVAWLDNELGLAWEFLRILDPTAGESPVWSEFETVRHVRLQLERNTSIKHLSFLHHVVVDLGGSQNEAFFELRHRSAAQVHAWFRAHA